MTGSDVPRQFSLATIAAFALGIAFYFIGLSSLAFAQYQISDIRLSQIDELVASVTRELPEVRPELEVTQEKEVPVFIFIPGILGSKLTDPRSGEVIWGMGLPAVTELALRPGDPHAEAEVLDRYFLEIYQHMKTELLTAVGDEKLIKWFPYDWRRDIEDLASRLDEKLKTTWREELKGRQVIFIAHSMGALIAWTWKNRYYRADRYGFDLRRLIVLGAPLEGACEMLRMLLKGYGPMPGKGREIFEEPFYEILFRDLWPSAFTFPSVFQLLPHPERLDRRTNCLIVELPETGLTAVDHFSP